MNITYTLIADGSSDKTLIPVINWVLDQLPHVRYVSQYAERTLKAKEGLRKRVESAANIYQCDILFVHRDAENMDIDLRVDEIHKALGDLGISYVPVVPIRMTEAWLLLDEKAIRSAANNPNGKDNLRLPPIAELENLVDPKQVLFEALKLASGLSGRRLASFQPERSRHRVADLIDDFLPLRKLDAFKKFEQGLLDEIAKLPGG